MALSCYQKKNKLFKRHPVLTPTPPLTKTGAPLNEIKSDNLIKYFV